MKYALTVAAAIASVATPALSLSCLRPDVVRMYEEIRDAEASYWLLKGRITPLEPVALPRKNAQGQYDDDARATTAIRFAGLGLSTDGTYKPFAQEMAMTVECVSIWCGDAPMDAEVFAAVELTVSGPELTIGPCPWYAIPVTDDGEARLLSCIRDGDCRYD